MCEYCDGDSYESCVWVDPLTNEYYLDIETSEWDDYDDGFCSSQRIYKLLPYCGRKLND